jgi:predicted MPP superfamily phosphohydrolase
LALLGHAVLWTAAVNRLHGWGGPLQAVKGLTLACLVALVGLPIAAVWQLRADETTVDPFAAGGWLQPYSWTCAVIGGASLIVKLAVEACRYDRRVLVDCKVEPRHPARALGAKPLEGALARWLDRIPGNEATSLVVDRKRLAVPRLPAELEGLTIAHISDLHMTGRIGAGYFSYLADQINSLRPDVIAITGDIVEKEVCWPWLDQSLGKLCAPLGVYFILGNHDAFVDADRTRAILADAGMTYLGGRWVRADWNGAAVLLGGNEQPWIGPAAPRDALPPRPPDNAEFRHVLCHTPDRFAWCVRAEADLALAGHTHGGQIQFPLYGPVASPSLFGTRYACGVFRRGHTVLHVTRGIAGQTPLRWRCPPEIALLELTRAPVLTA